MSILKLICKLNTIPTRILAKVFVDIDKITIKLIWKGKGSGIANTILKKKKKIGGFILCDFKHFYRSTIIKTVVKARSSKP